VFQNAQLAAKPDQFDGKIVFDEVQFLSQGRKVFLVAQPAPHDPGEAGNHGARLFGLTRIRVEMEFSVLNRSAVNLARQRFEARLHQQAVLFFQLGSLRVLFHTFSAA